MSDQLTILGVPIDRVTQTQALHVIQDFIDSRKPHYIVTANAEIIYQASQDEAMHKLITGADLITADGSGVVWASKYIGQPLAQRVTGIDLVHAICQTSQSAGWRIYILGAAPGIAQQAADKLREQYPACHIVGVQHGYFAAVDEPQLIEQIRQAQPDILLVAMGAPRQEIWITKHQAELQIPVAMGIGGSLDVISGNLKRAPQWMQKLSLEWLYRLIIQPTRFKRMLALPKFVLAVRKEQRQARRKQK